MKLNTYYPDLSPPAGICEAGAEPSCYVAGPMRGLPLYNFAAFFQAAMLLRRAGWRVENPAEYDMAEGLDPAAEIEDQTITVQEMLTTDLKLILSVDAVVLLPGWEASEGAKIEIAVGVSTGRKFFEMKDRRLRELVVTDLQIDIESVCGPKEDA